MRHAWMFLAFIVLAAPAFAVDLGKAAGSLVIDGNKIDLQYAYAVDHQKNQLTNKSNDTRVILTDKPLPDGTKLEDVDYNFPDGVLGVVICLTPKDDISHIIVQHPTGTYDGGYFEGVQDYHFARARSDRGTIAGTLSTKKIKTNTMTFSVDAEFATQVK